MGICNVEFYECNNAQTKNEKEKTAQREMKKKKLNACKKR